MTRNEWLDLFTPIYDEFAMIAFGSVETKHPEVFDVVVDPTKDYKHNRISGLGIWDSVDEDTSDGIDHFVVGYEGTITPTKYRKFFYVTFESNDQMEYAELKSKTTQADALGRGGAGRLETLTANLISDGFATASSPDGQYLFDTDHPKNPEETGTTYSNLLSGAFSHDNLEAAEQQISANFFDMDGLPMVTFAGKPKLIYPSALRGPVQRVLMERAGERPSTTVRDINIYSGKYMAVEWAFLDSVLGGSDTAWYIIYPQLKSLKLVKNTAAPEYASWIDNMNQRYYFDGWIRAAVGAADWRGLFGSTGV